MNRTIPTLITAGALALTLTACGVQWDEDTKRTAWDRRACQDLSRLDGDTVASTVSIAQLSGDIPSDQTSDAASTATALLRADKAGDVVNPQGGWGCDGWLWGWWQKRDSYLDGYEEFTQEEAEQAGVLEGL